MKNLFLAKMKKSIQWSGCLLGGIILFCSCEKESVNNLEPVLRNEPAQAELREMVRASFETDVFITEWTVPKDASVILPLDTAFTYNFIVDWGDNSDLQQITNNNYYAASHRYSTSGVYRIRILGTCETFRWQNNDSRKYLTQVIQWGNVHFKSLRYSFSSCTSLAAIPVGIPNVEDYNTAFSGCTSLTSLPAGLFEDCYNARYFTGVFSGCKNLKSLPADLFKGCYNAEIFNSAFSGTGLMFLPSGLFKDCNKANLFSITFFNCYQLIEIPGDLFAGCENATGFYRTFWNCTSLTSIPAELFDHCKKVTQFTGTFQGCSGVKGMTPSTKDNLELWDRAGKQGYPVQVYGNLCFNGCVNLSNYSAIPADWK